MHVEAAKLCVPGFPEVATAKLCVPGFLLAGKLTGLNGWIIQKVEFSYDITPCCNPNPTNRDPPVDECYFEAWKVKDGIVYFGDSDEKQGPMDGDGTGIANYPDTVGTITVTATVAFLKDYDLRYPPWGRAGEGDHPRQVKTLPWKRCESGAPTGWEDVVKITRKLVSEWDCCSVPKKETDISKSGGWAGMCLNPIEY